MSKTPVYEDKYPQPTTQTASDFSASGETPERPAPAVQQLPSTDTYDQDKLGFDLGETSGDALSDMTGLLDTNNDYMKRAESRGKQYANDRGMLNSTMGGQAAQAAMIDAAMPMVQTMSAERNASRGMTSDIYRQEDSQLHDFSVTDRQYQQDERMLDLETRSKDALISLEQQYNLAMTNNENLSQAWGDITTGISDIFRAGLTADQTAEALDYMLGPEVDGVRTGGMASATLQFHDALFNDGADVGVDTGDPLPASPLTVSGPEPTYIPSPIDQSIRNPRLPGTWAGRR